MLAVAVVYKKQRILEVIRNMSIVSLTERAARCSGTGT